MSEERKRIAKKWSESRWGERSLSRVSEPREGLVAGMYGGSLEKFGDDLREFAGDDRLAIRWSGTSGRMGVIFPLIGSETKTLPDVQLIWANDEEIRMQWTERGRAESFVLAPVSRGRKIDVLGTVYDLEEIRHFTFVGNLLMYKTDREDDLEGYWLREILGEEVPDGFCAVLGSFVSDAVFTFARGLSEDFLNLEQVVHVGLHVARLNEASGREGDKNE